MDCKPFQVMTPWGVPVNTFYREGTSDAGTIISCLVQDEYKLEKLGLGPGDIAIDLGSHIGAVSLALASRGVCVVAVEAIPENVEIARRAAEANSFGHLITTHHAAASGKTDDVSMYYTGTKTSTGKIHEFVGTAIPHEQMGGYTESGRQIKVPSMSLEDIFRGNDLEHCNLLKCDIEGSEWSLFSKAGRDLLFKIEIITGEVHRVTPDGEVSRDDLLPFLHDLFIDITIDYDAEHSVPGPYTHFVYKNKAHLNER